MKIIAIEKECPGIPPEAFTSSIKKAEATRIWELYQSGEIREMFFRQDRSEAVLIMECDTIAECQSILDSFPMKLSGLIDFEIIPLRPYPGFERLFSKNQS